MITSNDGAFVLTRIRDDDVYSVLAHRMDGVEAIAAHVKAGSHITIELPRPAAISGVVQQAGKPADEFEVSVTQLEEPVERHGTRFGRRERFFRTAGRFTVSGLLPLRYRVAASTAGSQAVVDIDLTRPTKPIVLDLDPLIEISGRVLEHPSGKPLAGVNMRASRTLGSSTFASRRAAVTDADGRFKITDAARGNVELWGTSLVGDHRVSVVRTISTSTDVGDLFMPAQQGDRWGLADLGVRFARIDPDLPADQRALVVEMIDPNGPAAKSELKLGDVVIAIDGLDVTGGNSAQATSLMLGTAGVKVVLKTKRGVVVELTR